MKPAKFGIIDNFQTFTDNIGGSSNTFNGVDFSVNARLRDVTIQGGTSTGNVVEDECGVVAQHPEMYISGLGWGGSLDFFKQFNPSHRPVAAGLLPSRVGMADEPQRAGVVHGAQDRRPAQRDVAAAFRIPETTSRA